MHTFNDFKCTKCGECCRMVVKLSKEDIQRINKIYQKDFTRYDKEIKSNVLKHNNGKCVFLKKQGDEYVCSIYEHRPEVCKQYPFIDKQKIEDCRPPRWEYWPKINSLFQSK
jgi:Fe-S-cluster containining protein